MPEDIKAIVTQRSNDGVESSYAQTTGGESPNIIVQALSPLRVITTRVVRVYLQSVTGIVSAGMAGADGGLLPDDFATLFVTACRMSVAIGGITALQNFVELLTKIDQKYPEIRA
jgi:hypothetical protein